MNTISVVAKFEKTIQECFQEIDSSFNKINDFLDSIPLGLYPSIPQSVPISAPAFTQISYQSIQESPSQLIQEVKPILKSTMDKTKIQMEGLEPVVQQQKGKIGDNKIKQEMFIQREKQLEKQFTQQHREQIDDNQLKQEIIIQGEVHIEKLNTQEQREKVDDNKIKQKQRKKNFEKQVRQQQIEQIDDNKIKQQIIINKDAQQNYKLQETRSIKQNEWCSAIAINKDNSIVVAGCESKIKVFEFKLEQLKQTQLLSEHGDFVRTLNFMKSSPQFVSGSDDSQIIIWSMNQNRQWICQQKLNGHTSCINCLVLSENEDFIISGSDDKTIKFWAKQNEWLCSQTITDDKNIILGLSLNEQQNRVIFCGSDMEIVIIEQSYQDQKWDVIQRITVEEWGYRLCFISDNVFTFQPYCKEYMHVYEMSNTDKQYSKVQEIQVKCDQNSCNYWFPQQYIKSKCLLVNKNGSNVNLIRKNKNGDFIAHQSIDFERNSVFGQMTEDGKYLMTWDRKSKQIQIRKYHENG